MLPRNDLAYFPCRYSQAVCRGFESLHPLLQKCREPIALLSTRAQAPPGYALSPRLRLSSSLLVPGLRLGTHCPQGSAFLRLAGIATKACGVALLNAPAPRRIILFLLSKSARRKAEPRRQCVPSGSLGTRNWKRIRNERTERIHGKRMVTCHGRPSY